MGTSLELRVGAEDEKAAKLAEARVLAEIDRLSSILSGYDQTSEFSRWKESLNVATEVSPELFEMLRASDEWRERSKGAFDPRVEALTLLWSRCAKLGRTPTAAELEAVKAIMSKPAWRLDSGKGIAEHLSTCPLTLNAIAKGYIVGKATEAGLKGGGGVRSLLLNVGGDLRVQGDLSLRIGIASPSRDSETTAPITRIEVADCSVATSGNYQRGLWIQNHWYSHIFDPMTGIPAARAVAATVIARSASDADALATIFNVLTIEESLSLARKVPDVECLLVSDDGTTFRSPGFRKYERPVVSRVSLQEPKKPRGPDIQKMQEKSEAEKKSAPAKNWNEDYELLVKFEINAPDRSGRYRRPYVAVWIEDKDGLSVRTVMLWVSLGGSGPSRWLPDLKRWYRDDEARRLVDDVDLVHTMARATRSPGKYEAIWDGKDDHGQSVPAGEYTLFIEAAREHGTYQIIRKQVIIGDKKFVEELKGNVEIKSAVVEYRRKSAGAAKKSAK